MPKPVFKKEPRKLSIQNFQKSMSLESISQELKNLVSTFDTKWFLGELSNQMKNAGSSMAPDELKGLSSPQ